MLPFGIQSTQIHINYWNEKNFLDFKKFIEKNYSKVIDANTAFSKNSNSNFNKFINYSLKRALKLKRILFKS